MSATLVATREITDRALGSRELDARYFELAGRALQEAPVSGLRRTRARACAPLN